MSVELRTEPRISVNKLAEYLLAPPRRRRRLILDQIQVQPVKVINYEHARRALTRSLADPVASARTILRSASILRDRAAAESDGYRQSCFLASARALEAFAPTADRIRPKGVLAVPGIRRGADLTISGVRIVVAPDVFFVEKGTEEHVGAVKVHFPRTTPLSSEALQYVAVLLFEYLKANGDSPRRQYCIGVDVFSERFESTPRATVDRIRNVEAACEEIAERWPALYSALAADDSRTKSGNQP